MNVNDFGDDTIPTDFSELDRLSHIFSRQHELAEKYVPIEVKNGLRHTTDMPVDIDTPKGQAQLKDFFWRITEELTEAAEAARVHKHIPTHTIEELADALHFFVEACILSDIDSSLWFTDDGRDRLVALMHRKLLKAPTGDKTVDRLQLDYACWETTLSIGCASNCLKQRPWKTNHQLTDRPKFNSHMHDVLLNLTACFVACGLNADQVLAIYFKKSEVNKFRQRSGY